MSRSTIIDLENGTRVPHRNNLLAIRRALEAMGVEFIEEGKASPDGGPGVRLDRPIDGAEG